MKKLMYFVITFLSALLLFAANIGDNDLILGDSISSNNKTITMGDSILKWNGSTSKLQFAHDGAVFSDMGEFTNPDPTVFNNVGNPQAEVNTTGWSTYVDAAGTSPVDGTGGTANITLTRTTSTPIRQTGSFLISKDASDRQGEGISYDFTVEPGDLNSIMEITLDHTESANYADDDIAIFIYNKDTPGLITPSLNELKDGEGSFKTYFTTDSADDDYRLIIHIASTNATAYDIKIDNIKIVKKRVNDLISSAPEGRKVVSAYITNSGTPTISRQDGDWISSLDDDGTGQTTININSGIFSTATNCFCSVENYVYLCTVNSVSSSSFQTRTWNPHAEINGDQNFSVLCVGY